VLASSSCETDEPSGVQPQNFATQEVGNQGYLQRHNSEMFKDGRSFSGNERDKLFLNRGDSTFLDLSDLSGCDSANDGRAAVACDFDDDGDVDLFVHELQRERHALYRNELGSLHGSFLKLRLRATTKHWEAIGATVSVEADGHRSAQTLSRGSGYLTSQAPELIFGLGPDADEAQVRVRWPGGGLDEYTLAAGGRYELVEGRPARPFEAKPTPLPDPLPPGLELTVGDLVPPLAVLDPDGTPTVLNPAELAKGGALYLNLWASYCGPCVAELPLLKSKHSSAEANVVALSMDAPGDRDKAQALLEARGATFPAFYLGEGAGAGTDQPGAPIGTLLDMARLPIPTTLVLDAEGRITEVIRGPLPEDG
jgi:thiol-disulfide isomerase/thioredoxin